VSDSLLVQVLQSPGQVLHNPARLRLCEADSSLDVVEKRPAEHLLKDEVETIGLFKILYQLDYVWLSPAEMVDLNFFEHL